MSYLKKANEAFRAKNYRDAVEFYEKALKNSPDLKSIIEFNLEISKSKVENKSTSIAHENATKEVCQTSLPKSKKKVNSCVVKFDNTNKGFAQGWAMDTTHQNNTIVLQASIDGVSNSLVETSLLRNDVKKAHGGDGFYGYRAELNPYLSFSQSSKVNIAPVSHQLDTTANNTLEKPFPSILKGQHFRDVNERASEIVQGFVHPISPLASKNAPKVSVIILNLNGENVLKDCMSSLLKWNTKCEIIVVDHASTDNSVGMLAQFKNDRIKVIKRDKNYSYSDSNNLGAREASGDVLIFLNNDIVLTSDSITSLSNIVSNTEFGLMGIRLWDLPKGNNFKLEESIRVDQHLGVQFKALGRNDTIEAFELRSPSFITLEKGILETPAVTAAMVAIKKDEFDKLGGFNDKYFYGQEDVDFCLRYYRDIGRKTGVLLDEGAYHIRGLSRRQLSQNNHSYIGDNRRVIQSELGGWFRKEIREGVFKQPGFWNQKPLAVAMVVSEVSFETDKADFFTAKELGDAFEENGNTVVGYFDSTSDYDVTGYDLVIVYIDGFDPRCLKGLSPHTLIIGWARNWFDRWCERVWIEHYDFIYASSEKARKFMEDRLKRKVGLLRIAASNECARAKVEKNSKYSSDYVFTGSYFNSPREITDLLEPKKIPHRFKLFGYNWENHEKFNSYTNGPVSYKDIPSVYANTQIVVDDANIATKKWGAVNCRVYDALSMGVICITNNTIGVEEIFDEDFPTYVGEEVNDHINTLLGDEKHREQLAKKYRSIVLEKHTYQNRRDQILRDIKSLVEKKSISIKIAAPDFERGVKWGDYHFAKELRFEFEKLGIKVRIECLDQWHGERSLNDDINLVLRGLSRFKGRADQKNFMWMISHPDMICEEELRDFDHIFVASKLYSEKLRLFTGLDNISSLEQASSFSKESFDLALIDAIPKHEILFVGNSRNEFRESVKWCVEAGLPISIYGGGWEQFVPKELIKGEFVDNQLLQYYYHNAGVVLNDHWEDMRNKGFMSNRAFDILASGGVVFSDYVPGIETHKLDNLNWYSNKEEFVDYLVNKRYKLVQKREINSFECSFASRVESIITCMERSFEG